MTYYSRAINSRLIFRRALIIVLCILTLELFKRGLTNYIIIIVLLTFCFSLFPLTALTINYDSFRIKKYYFFGLMPFSWAFKKNDYLKIDSFDIDLESDNDAYLMDSDFFFSWTIPLMPTPKLRIKIFVIKFLDKKGKLHKLKQKLTDEEYNLLLKFVTP
jgi:hypothetical protein